MDKVGSNRVEPFVMSPTEAPLLASPNGKASLGTAAFESMLAAHSEADRNIGAATATISVAGSRIELRICGALLAQRMMVALRHLAATGEGARQLTVLLWDCAAAGRMRPAPDLRRFLPEAAPFGDGLVAREPGGLIGYQTPRLFALLDVERGILVGCVTDAAALSFFEIGKPLQPLLFHWHMRRGVLPVHAGLVAIEGQGLLLGGKGGSGKSTTALACVRAGFSFLGDDYVGLQRVGAGREVIGHSFYSSAWLDVGHGARLPWIQEHPLPGQDSGERKSGYLVGEAFRSRLAVSAPVTAVAIPRVTDVAVASGRRISAAEALRRLAPSSLLQSPFLDPGWALGELAAVVRQKPCYEMSVGPDLSSIGVCANRILAGELD